MVKIGAIVREDAASVKDQTTRRPAHRVFSPVMDSIRTLVSQFTDQLSSLIEGQAMERARAAVESALGGGVRRGRPTKALAVTVAKKPRKKGPLQLCPVPGCKNPAAPVYGMVCANHKNVAKTKIRKYREARKAKKLGIVVKAPKRRTKKVARPKSVGAAKPAAATAA